MKQFSREDIKNLSKVYRLNLINSISGFKASNLIGTKSKNGQDNLAIISSVIHLGSNPALLGFIMRPGTVERHTYTNIKDTGSYTINAVPTHMIKNAHYTSAKFDANVSEFEACQIEPETLNGFHAPFVRKSPLKMAMKFEEAIPISLNDTILVIGSVENLYTVERAISDNGQLDLNALEVTTISGLNRYHKAEQIGLFPYARVEDLPDFSY